MNNNDRIFRVIAVTGLVLGVVALVRYELVIQALNETTDVFKQFMVDEKFAIIVDHYDQDGEEK